MIEIRRSKPEEIPRLQELFHLCFGDGPEWSGIYFHRFYRPEELVVLLEEGELCAMAGLLRLTLTGPDGGTARAAYLYGLATHPDRRGRGHATHLLCYADFYLRDKADCLIAVPEDESLTGFYQKRGFSLCFSMLEGTVVPRPTEKGGARRVDAVAYDALREQLLVGRCHVSYGGLAGMQEGLCAHAGGALLALDVDGAPGCAAVEPRGDTVLCKELLAAPEALEGAAALVARELSAPRLTLRVPAFQPHEGLERREFGMIKWYAPAAAERWQAAKEPYLGLAFD